MDCRAALAVVLSALPAHAVVVRGKVTDALGRPLAGARVQLIRGPRNMADTIAGADGSYEIRSADSGRFLLLTSSPLNARYAAVQIGSPFYAGRADVVVKDVFLDPAYLTPQVSAQATLLSTPLPVLADATTQIAADQFLTAATPLAKIRQLPSALLVQRGAAGTPAELYVRGAGPQTLKIEVAGVSAEDLGGGFNFATLSTLGLAAVDPVQMLEVTPGALPLADLDAEGGVLTVQQTSATEVRPSLTVTGDAGNLATLRGEGTGEITRRRADLRAGFSRLDTDSGEPALGFHLAAAEANAGYNISAATSLRLLVRRDVTSAPLTVPRQIFNLQPAGKDAAQNLYGSLTFDTTAIGSWHNRLRYGLARKRREVKVFALPTYATPVTLRGANGSTAVGTPALPALKAREDLITNRDELSYQTDYPVAQNHRGVLRLSYLDERAADLLPAVASRYDSKHLSVAAGLKGSLFAARLHHRLFYEAAATGDHSATLGWLGAPRLGFTFVPVFPGVRTLRGTTLHATAAAGFGEPGILALEFTSASASKASAPRSRTFTFGVDQVLLPQKLTTRATYFHSQFSHQEEALAFNSISPTLGYRAQGIETAIHYQPFPRVFVAGGYTYLAALVEQTAEKPGFNPVLGTQPIGTWGALAGSRPFDRPPHSGWLAAHFTGPRFSVAVDASFSGRSDSSSGYAQTATLLLPNHALSPGYVALNAGAMYRFGTHVAVYTQLDNLFNDRHIAPFGYLSTPFLVRTGLRLRLGGD